MPTSLNVNEPRRPHRRARAYAGAGTVVAIAVLIAVGFVWLAVGTIYLDSAAGLDLQAQGAPMIDPGG
jgi:hypothetical protein